MLKKSGLLAISLCLVAPAPPALAQDANILLPTDSIERLLREHTFEVVDWRGSRAVGDRTSRAALKFPGEVMMLAKFAPAARGGEAFNNNPRFEVGAYVLQKLFLTEPDYVVPPTVLRAFPLALYRQWDRDAAETFGGTGSTVATVQYWLFNVQGDGFWDDDRFEVDTAYARHFADFNILTYLVRHNDMNTGNYLISNDPANPRVFSVDNGLAFSSEMSDRGADWRRLRVDRVPAATIERLRGLTEESLIRELETLAQFRVTADGQLIAMEPTENLSPNRGVRRNDDYVQFGLTRREIRGVWRRLEELLEDVDEGDLEVF